MNKEFKDLDVIGRYSEDLRNLKIAYEKTKQDLDYYKTEIALTESEIEVMMINEDLENVLTKDFVFSRKPQPEQIEVNNDLINDDVLLEFYGTKLIRSTHKISLTELKNIYKATGKLPEILEKNGICKIAPANKTNWKFSVKQFEK